MFYCCDDDTLFLFLAYCKKNIQYLVDVFCDLCFAIYLQYPNCNQNHFGTYFLMIDKSATITGVIRNSNNDANPPLLIEACFVVSGTDLSASNLNNLL